MEQPPKRLDALIRVSQRNGREGDSFRSPGQQREACERWAAANGAEIVAWHEGIGRSGKTMQRDDVNAALERIRARQIDGVIVAWLDRFSRAPVREALGVYEDITAAGGKVVAVDMAGLNPRDPTGEMALTVMLSVGRMQWRQAAARWDMSRKEAVEDGKAVGGAPYGYRFKDPTPKGPRSVVDSRLVVDKDEEKIVRELFERKAAGATWLELARWMDTVAPKPNGGHWARSTVRDMIGRKTYLGEIHHGTYSKAGTHEEIVSPALWRRAQNAPGRRTPRGAYLLSGLARCAGCGRRLRGRGAGRIYSCGDQACSARPTIVVSRLDAEVVEQFFAHLDAFSAQAVNDGDLAAADSEVKRLDAELETLAMVSPKHPTGVAAQQRRIDELEAALGEAEDRVHDLTASLSADGPDVRELRDDWPTLTLAEQREILRAGIDAVLVRRAPSPKAKPPVADRILVLFRGMAPDGLADNGRSGSVATWVWDDDPGSLRTAP